MISFYTTKIVQRVTGATDNQLKYWVGRGVLSPSKDGKRLLFTFKDIIKTKMIVSLKRKGLSLQKIRKGLGNLTKALPDSDESLVKLVILTDGSDMIVNEKGTYFSAITKQQYFRFDTESIQADIINLNKKDFSKTNKRFSKRALL